MSRSSSYTLAEQHSDFSEALVLPSVALVITGYAVFGILALMSWFTTGHAIAVPSAISAAGPPFGFLMLASIVPILGKEESDPAMWLVRATVFIIQIGFLVAIPVGVFMRLTHQQ